MNEFEEKRLGPSILVKLLGIFSFVTAGLMALLAVFDLVGMIRFFMNIAGATDNSVIASDICYGIMYAFDTLFLAAFGVVTLLFGLRIGKVPEKKESYQKHFGIYSFILVGGVLAKALIDLSCMIGLSIALNANFAGMSGSWNGQFTLFVLALAAFIVGYVLTKKENNAGFVVSAAALLALFTYGNIGFWDIVHLSNDALYDFVVLTTSLLSLSIAAMTGLACAWDVFAFVKGLQLNKQAQPKEAKKEEPTVIEAQSTEPKPTEEKPVDDKPSDEKKD